MVVIINIEKSTFIYKLYTKLLLNVLLNLKIKYFYWLNKNIFNN